MASTTCTGPSGSVIGMRLWNCAEPRRRGEFPPDSWWPTPTLLDADAARLRLVSDSFVELGYIPFAADAIAHAIIALRSAVCRTRPANSRRA